MHTISNKYRDCPQNTIIMIKKIHFFTCFFIILLSGKLNAQILWEENFDQPGWGLWGSGNGNTVALLDGVTWTLDGTGCHFYDENDYAKTVATSGGRFEVLDSDGEVVWTSPQITINPSDTIRISVSAGETGSNSAANKKYIRTGYLLDGRYGSWQPDSVASGNWGSTVLSTDLSGGSTLQIKIMLNSSYSNDKVYVDEIKVESLVNKPSREANPSDLIINEIMADPVPSAGLPEAEYIELYNRSLTTLSTEGWSLINRQTGKAIPPRSIEPEHCLLLCSPADTNVLSVYGPVAEIKSFPALLNQGATLLIRDQNGKTIDSVSYSDQWYSDHLKASGGWSLERIDPDRFCGSSGNWTASVHPSGGTPGKRNSVETANPDTTAPAILSIQTISDRAIRINLSEPLLSAPLTGNDLTIDQLRADTIGYNQGETTLYVGVTGIISPNTTYSLKTKLTDECGNVAENAEGQFFRSEIGPGDLLISEILFNPKPGVSDFIEIYNSTEHPFLVSALILATRDANLQIKSLCRPGSSNLTIEPMNFMVFSSDIESLGQYYEIPYPERLIRIDRTPPMADDQGIVVLLNDSMNIIDEMAYTDEMHSLYLSDTEGVSLERLSFFRPAADPTNWHSASSLTGFATPGYRNAQTDSSDQKTVQVSLSSSVLSPNGDGINDDLTIDFQTPQPGILATIRLFGMNGQSIALLANNVTINDGDYLLVPMSQLVSFSLKSGIYLLWIELIQPQGKKYQFKKALSVTF